MVLIDAQVYDFSSLWSALNAQEHCYSLCMCSHSERILVPLEAPESVSRNEEIAQWSVLEREFTEHEIILSERQPVAIKSFSSSLLQLLSIQCEDSKHL